LVRPFAVRISVIVVFPLGRLIAPEALPLVTGVLLTVMVVPASVAVGVTVTLVSPINIVS